MLNDDVHQFGTAFHPSAVFIQLYTGYCARMIDLHVHVG